MKTQLFHAPALFDILHICHRLVEEERDEYTRISGAPYDADRVAAATFLLEGPKWLLNSEAGPVSAGGFMQLQKGVYRTWILNTPESFGVHGRELTRVCKTLVSGMLATPEVNRVECLSLADRVKAHRWYTTLGLADEPIAVLRGYGANGETVFLFSKARANVQP